MAEEKQEKTPVNIKTNPFEGEEKETPHTIWLLIQGYHEKKANRGFALLYKAKNMKRIEQKRAEKRQELLEDAFKKMTEIYSDEQMKENIKTWIQEYEKKAGIQKDQKQISYYNSGFAEDVKELYKTIQQKEGHHCYMTINIAHSEQFDKYKLMIKIEEAYKYACSLVNGKRLIIYFSGHGEHRTGNWILNPEIKETSMTHEDIVVWCNAKPQSAKIVILADCCHSGEWIDKFRKKQKNTNMIFGSSIATKYGLPYAFQRIFRLWMCEKENGIYCSKATKEEMMILTCTGDGNCFEKKFPETANIQITLTDIWDT